MFRKICLFLKGIIFHSSDPKKLPFNFFWIQYDIRDQSVQQIYDSHIKEVRTLTFFDNNKRFVSTALDNHLRMYEWGIPVETKQIKDVSLGPLISAITTKDQSMYLAQCMDSSIKTFDLSQGFRFQRKKTYSGHTIAGFNCHLDLSPDENYVISGDNSGNLFVWDFRVRKIERRIFTQKSTIISSVWNPYHDSLIATGDSLGNISMIR